MIYLSRLMIQHPEIDSFADFLDLVNRYAGAGERFLRFDLKPDYVDTPRDWQAKVEAAFYRLPQ